MAKENQNTLNINYSNWSSQDIELLNKERKKINVLDEQILSLLNERAHSSLAIGDLKKRNSNSPKIYDAKREQELLQNLYQANTQNSGILTDKHIESIWREIMSSSRALQKNFKLSFLGPEGTFSYFAGKEFFGDNVELLPCADFQEIFENVAEGKCSGGIIPLENSLYGTVGTCFDLFAKIDVAIEAEFYSKISLNILSNETSLPSIKKVYSHAQPLGQASEWLRSHLPQVELIPVESSALAASLAKNEAHSAAIGHQKLSENLDLNILASSIENDKNNWTRFVLITKKSKNQITSLQADSSKILDKSSVIFTLKDTVGSLAEILSSFATAKINLQKLESRPMPNQAWKYLFFADLNCNIYAHEHMELIEKLNDQCSSFTILGSYPSNQDGIHL